VKKQFFPAVLILMSSAPHYRAIGWLVAVGLVLLGVAPLEGVVDERALLRAEHRQLLQVLSQRQLKSPYIVIDTHDNRLQLRAGGEMIRDAACSTGSGRRLEGEKAWYRWIFATPRGRFSVLRKVVDPLWIRPVWDFIEAEEEIPIFAEDRRRFQRGILGEYALYFAKDFMIHGTLYEVNLGKSITHGCVRVGAEDLQYLYDTVEKGWPVFIY
jgi:hypothetical protein